jgi:4-amino-4-deoxy-L-arabinose transferase-like glycosyltransferase
VRRLRPPTALVVIVVVGAALRVAWAAYAARSPAGLHDPGFYRVLADVLAHGHGYSLPPVFNPPGVGFTPTAYYPPLYPMVLGGIEWITLHTPLPEGMTGWVVALNVVASIVSIVLVYDITRRIADERTAIVASAIVALWPNLVVHAATTLSETLFIAVMLFGVWLAVAGSWRAISWPRLIAVGVVIGVATLVRPVALPLIPAFAIAWAVAGVGWRTVLTRSGVVAMACAAVLIPWIARNAAVMGSTVLSTNTGDNLCMSRQPGANGAFQLTSYCNQGDPSLHRPEAEVKQNDENQHKAITFVRDHPATEIRLWFSRLRWGFSNDADGVRAVESYDDDRFLPDWVRTTLNTTANLWFAGVGLLALGSLPWWLRRRDPGAWFVASAAVGVGVIPIVVFFGDPRFHVPMAPFLAILAAGALTGWAWRPRPAERGRSDAPVPSRPATKLARMVSVRAC